MDLKHADDQGKIALATTASSSMRALAATYPERACAIHFGLYFGYPECCVSFFVTAWDDIWPDPQLNDEYCESLPRPILWIPCPACKLDPRPVSNRIAPYSIRDWERVETFVIA